MKKYILALSILACMSCGGNSSDNSSSSNESSNTIEAETEPVKTEDPEVTKGMQLIANSDCLTCHKLTETLVGPAYAAIAEKYKSDSSKVSYLVEKIIKGGSGVWGTVPMAPHPSISEQEARTMITYIMSVKN